MRAAGTTMISRDSIVYPMMAGGSKGEIKEGSPRRSPDERRFSSKAAVLTTPTARAASGLCCGRCRPLSPLTGGWVSCCLGRADRSRRGS